MRIRLFVNATTALKAGKDEHGPFVVEVPAAALTPEQRDELALHTSDNDKADFDLSDQRLRFPLAEATPDKVMLILDGLIAIRRKAEQEKADAHEKAVQQWLALPVEQWVWEGNRDVTVYEWRCGTGSRPEDPRLAEKLEQARALAARLTEEKQAERARVREENECRAVADQASKNAASEMFKQWAQVHGSDLLKARIEEKFAWEELAELEYANQLMDSLGTALASCPNLPEGYISNEYKERTTPTMDEIKELRLLRARAEGKPIIVELQWVTYKPKEDECSGEALAEPLGRPEIGVTVICPNGAKKYFFFLPSGVDQPSVS